MNKKKMTFRFLNKVDSSKCFKIPPKYILKMSTFNKCSTR